MFCFSFVNRWVLPWVRGFEVGFFFTGVAKRWARNLYQRFVLPLWSSCIMQKTTRYRCSCRCRRRRRRNFRRRLVLFYTTDVIFFIKIIRLLKLSLRGTSGYYWINTITFFITDTPGTRRDPINVVVEELQKKKTPPEYNKRDNYSNICMLDAFFFFIFHFSNAPRILRYTIKHVIFRRLGKTNGFLSVTFLSKFSKRNQRKYRAHILCAY